MPHGIHVDVKVDLAVHDPQRDHATAFGKAVQVADREDTGASQGFEEDGPARFLRGADEEDMARPGVLNAPEVLHHHRMLTDGLALHDLGESAAEWIGTQDTDD